MASQENITGPRYYLPHHDPAYHQGVVAILRRRTPQSFSELNGMLTEVYSHSRGGLRMRACLFRGLSDAVQATGRDEFFDVVLPSILDWACALPDAFPGATWLSALVSGNVGSVAVSRVQARALLAYAFVCGLQAGFSQTGADSIGAYERARGVETERNSGFGALDFFGVFQGGVVGVQRVIALLRYFASAQRWAADGAAGEIVFKRCVLGADAAQGHTAAPMWATVPVPVTTAVAISAAVRIEDVDGAAAHVDFANKSLHIGCIISSATQEEVLFTIRPELYLGLLFCETMAPEEAIVMRGARQFVTYTGYGEAFRCGGAITDAEIGPVGDAVATIAIDAMIVGRYPEQFAEAALLRDLNKAYLGFVHGAQPGEVVSTGAWGCGVFRGDKRLKFLQQVLAASVAGVRVAYSTFGHRDDAGELQRILAALAARPITVAEVHALLVAFGQLEDPSGTDLADWFLERLGGAPSLATQ